MSDRRAVFLDRDGVINELVPDRHGGDPESPLRAADVRLIPGVGEALIRLSTAGLLLVGVSNQPAAAKRQVSVAELMSVQARVIELLSGHGVRLDDFRLCLHHPRGVVDELSGSCDCRKPAPGMLLAAARALRIDLARSWMIGDTDVDVLAGQAAGCRTVLVENRRSAHKRSGAVAPAAVAPDLSAAVGVVLA